MTRGAGGDEASRPRGSPTLTYLESEALAAVRELGEVGVAEVRAVLVRRGGPVAYTTVASALQRLYRRRLLTRGQQRVRGGRRYTFRVAEGDGALFGHLLDQIGDALDESTVARLISAIGSPSAEEIERIRRRLATE